MKRISTLLISVFVIGQLLAQAPQKMSYQAVVRTTNGELVKNSNVGMKISILNGSATGSPVYVETHTLTTNINGLVTMEIGAGTPVTGTFSGIDWSTGLYFIETKTDPSGGSNYSITGTSQLLSVPYALYSQKTENIDAIMKKLNDIENVVTTQLPPPSNGLVAYYPFNGNAIDESGNGFNGVVNNAVLTTDRFGKANSAFSFTDNQQITIPNSSNQNLYPLTISLWYNVSYLTDDWHGSGNVFSKYTTASWNGYQVLVGVFNNVPNNQTTENNGNGAASWYLKTPNDKIIGYYGERPFLQQNISLNTWYHYVFVVDQTGGKIYVNGKLIDSHPWTGNPGACTNSEVWKIGGLYNYWFKGKIDDIRIYNRALSETEIRQLNNENAQLNITKITDIDGNLYKTVKIGTQVWMAENLKATKYNDGTLIPNLTVDATWAALTTGAYSDYNNTPANSSIYGRLYNWYAIDNNAATNVASNGGKNLCPTGWHVPSVAEWTILGNYLGGNTIAGGKLKEIGTVYWTSPNTGATNESGFTSLPAGFRSSGGGFGGIGTTGNYWSSDDGVGNVPYWQVYYNSAGLHQFANPKKEGYSVRCIKD